MLSETHGGLNLRELRAANVDPNGLIDFSVNINPFGPSPQAVAAFHAVNPAVYPDRYALDLHTALAAPNELSPEHVLVGNGTAELIWLVAQASLKPADPVLIIGPTFGEYERAAQTVGAQVIRFYAHAPNFKLDIEKLTAEIERYRPRLVFLCNPNNPTGLFLSEPDVLRIAAACHDGLLILDEAYRAFVTQSLFGPPLAPNILVLRSMTKDHGLAGLRLGYALGQPHLLEAMRTYQPPWSVNSAAQAAGLASLNDLKYLYLTLATTRELANSLRTELLALGAQIISAPTHFILIEVGNAAHLRQLLMRQSCLVRDCTSFGLPAYIRIGTRRPVENAQFINAWKKLLKNKTRDFYSTNH